MSDAHAEFNPFQPPLSEAADAANVRLGDDDSFLIQKKRILCRDPVELPKICVFYGEVEDLEPRKATLKVLKPVSHFVVALLVVAVFVLPGTLFAGNTAPFVVRPVTDALKLAVCVCFVVGMAVLLWKKGCHEVNVTWYLCKRYRRRAVIERRIAQAIVLAGTLGLLVSLPWVEFSFQALFLAVVVAMLAGLRLNCEEKLRLMAKRDGAYVLEGHRKKFFEAVVRQKSRF